MSSTGLMSEGRDAPYRSGVDAAMRGRLAECDGGRSLEGTKFAGRQEFTGRLTGDFRDFGPYPWRWYLMTDLTVKPAGYSYSGVWCEENSLTFLDGQCSEVGD